MSTRKSLTVILLIGVVLRLLLLTYFWDRPLSIVDETHYQSIAGNILHNHEYALFDGKPTSMRPPLYPAFLSAIYFPGGGINMNAVRIIQIITGIATVYMVFLLGRRIFNDKAGLVAAFIFALYPSYLFFTHLLLTEILFTFLFVMFIWFFLSFLETSGGETSFRCATPMRKSVNIFWAGLFLGLGALTRSILYIFPAVAIIFILIAPKGTMIQKCKWVSVFILGYALVVTPWAVRNTLLHNQLVIVDTMGGLNLYHGNYEHTPLNRAWTAVDLTGDKAWYYGHEEELSKMNEAQKQQWAMKMAKEFILNNKLLTLKRDLIKAANFWGLERTIIGGILLGYYPEFSSKMYLLPITLLIFSFYILSATGAVFGLVYNFQVKRYDVVFVVILICFFTGMHALTFGHPRYHLPLVPLLVIFASWGLINMKTIWNNRNTRSFRISIALSFLLISIWVREIVFVEGERYLRNSF